MENCSIKVKVGHQLCGLQLVKNMSPHIGCHFQQNLPMLEDYSRFTALLPALCDRLSQALRNKQWAEARLLNETIRRKTLSVEAWLNWNVANAADTTAGAASAETKKIADE